jgi:hypothetical protein
MFRVSFKASFLADGHCKVESWERTIRWGDKFGPSQIGISLLISSYKGRCSMYGKSITSQVL